MKKILIVIGIIFGVFILLIVVAGVFLVNKESIDYKGHFDYTDSETLKSRIAENGKNAIVIITSPSCPGAPHFMPKIQNQQEILEQKNLNVHYVIDMLNTEEKHLLLIENIKQYNIHYDPLVMNPEKHPSGNLFNAKRKYDSFLTQLCGPCNDGSLGYPFYVYFRNGKYFDKSYYLDNEILASLD